MSTCMAAFTVCYVTVVLVAIYTDDGRRFAIEAKGKNSKWKNLSWERYKVFSIWFSMQNQQLNYKEFFLYLWSSVRKSSCRYFSFVWVCKKEKKVIILVYEKFFIIYYFWIELISLASERLNIYLGRKNGNSNYLVELVNDEIDVVTWINFFR